MTDMRHRPLGVSFVPNADTECRLIEAFKSFVEARRFFSRNGVAARPRCELR